MHRPKRACAIGANRRIWNIDVVSDDGKDSNSDSIANDTDVIHINDVYADSDGDTSSNAESSDSEENENEPPQHQRVPAAARACVQLRNNPLQDKNGNIWERNPPIERCRAVANIVRNLGGQKPESQKNTVLETWQLFFTDAILADILHYSQIQLDSLQIDDAPQLILASLKSYFGVMYFRGANEDARIPVTELWSDHYSTFYRASMSRSMYQLWNRVMRFDNPDDRARRLPTDTFAIIRDVWSAVNERFCMFFTASPCITVDEQLVSSKCRSPHRVHCSKKPGKYGELI